MIDVTDMIKAVLLVIALWVIALIVIATWPS